jgi:hypothetical protein
MSILDFLGIEESDYERDRKKFYSLLKKKNFHLEYEDKKTGEEFYVNNRLGDGFILNGRVFYVHGKDREELTYKQALSMLDNLI